MSRKRIVFLSSVRSEHDQELELFINQYNEIFMGLEIDYPAFICLDTSTARALHNHLGDLIEIIDSE